MGPSMDGLDKLLAMPYGCGEQNMLKFAPNIYVMDYLVATNQANGKVEDKAKEYMKSGSLFLKIFCVTFILHFTRRIFKLVSITLISYWSKYVSGKSVSTNQEFEMVFEWSINIIENHTLTSSYIISWDR